ncbi:MAG: RES family NAD+ phosphorylase [Burkholderiales bacterium]|nr:RES family NAD+ phosphorylase [Nitrosomonas sp.]MCP5275776.1 RES family NAD+ phosphorylase [Burkholderiales bacterium]
MTDKDDINKLSAKKICHHCIGEGYLSTEIKKEGKQRKCSYCGKTAKSYLVGDMADRIDSVFEEHYIRTPDEPSAWQHSLMSDKEIDYDWDRDGEPVQCAIMDSANMPEEAAIDIQIILEDRYGDFDAWAMGEETPFSSESHYEEKGVSDATWQEEWREFERSIKTEARFFSNAALKYLESVFENIREMDTKDGRSLIVNAGPDTDMSALFRARVFQSNDKLKTALMRPDIHLGSPPFSFAKAGRMNAHGISVFYGANDPDVALAEVRPPVGSQVAVARFEIIRSLNLLDLTALDFVTVKGSIFDPDFIHRLERAAFLNKLCEKITRPVMPDDEAFEYLATQAIADFLSTESDPQIDGIIFPSAQVAVTSLNVVLFHKASKVEKLNLPEGTELHAELWQMYEDGPEPEYSVTEEVAPKEENIKEENEELPLDLEWALSDSEFSEPTLKIDTDNIWVHIINSVKFSSSDFQVKRYRWEKKDPPF